MANEKRRLIDADALTHEIEALREIHRGKCTGTIYGGYTAALCAVDGAKTVDAVEVVRCKGCKYWGGVVYGGRCKYWSAPMSGMTHYTSADDFCSHGERKDNERKLIELISCADFHPTKGVVATIGSRFAPEFIEGIADRLISNGVTVQKWIPVSERLPEFETPVLIAIHLQRDIFARVGWLHESGMWSVPTTKEWLSDAVTHWMPLPKAPEEV